MAGPSALSIFLREGWSLPGVQDSYVRYESAGDRIVDRFVAGLPFESRNLLYYLHFFFMGQRVDHNVQLFFATALSRLKEISGRNAGASLWLFTNNTASEPSTI